MGLIKTIKVGDAVYGIKATYDGAGKDIELTYANKTEVATLLSNKVDKVRNKGLSLYDFDFFAKDKLEKLFNYNDSTIVTLLGNSRGYNPPTGIYKIIEDNEKITAIACINLDSRVTVLEKTLTWGRY